MTIQTENIPNEKPQKGEKGTCSVKPWKQIKKADQSKQETQQIFDKVLDNCAQLLQAYRGDMFELLDPLISDTQCQLHSIFIISRLFQANDQVGVPQCNFKKFSDIDKKLLSYAVLLSMLKYEEKDNVGFVIVSQLIDNLGILSGKIRAERMFIKDMKATFNSHSVEYSRKVANGNIKHIFDECDASVISKKSKFELKLLPCYANFFALFKQMEARNLPILISLIRFQSKSAGSDRKLCINSKRLLFYKFQKSTNSFVFKTDKELSEDEKMQPTIAITCFSVINDVYPQYFEEYMDNTEVPSERFLTEDCDIRDLLMVNAAGHIQLTEKSYVGGDMDPDNYIENLYKRNSNLTVKTNPHPFKGNFNLIEENIYGCYDFHYKIAERFGMANARYSSKSQNHDQLIDTVKSVQINRRLENTFFSADHVNVSTYSRDCELMNSYMVGAEVASFEPDSFDKQKTRTFLGNRLAEAFII